MPKGENRVRRNGDPLLRAYAGRAEDRKSFQLPVLKQGGDDCRPSRAEPEPDRQRSILRRKSVLESNMVQTIGSAGESLGQAGGIGMILLLAAAVLWYSKGTKKK